MENTTITHALRPSSARFLSRFVEASRAEDYAAVGTCFAESFVAGDVDGTSRVVTRQAFVAALPRRTAAARAAGIGAAALVGAAEEPLGGKQWLLRTEWASPRPGDREAIMISTFLLSDVDGSPQAIAYLTHDGLPHRFG